MPELPEVETVVRALRAAILGCRIVAVKYASRRIAMNNPRAWTARLNSHCIHSVSRLGKYIIITLTNHSHLIVHLRMTGRFRLYPAGQPRQKYDRLVIELEGGRIDEPQLLTLVDTRQFARADFVSGPSIRQHTGVAKLGPEANELSESQLRRALARSHRPVKSLLLDQTAVAGLGNIYADEALHAAGVHPLTPADSLDRGQIRRLRGAIIRILSAAIEACGTTFDTFSDLSGEAGGFAPQLMVYGREGEPCRHCHTLVLRSVIAGRSSHFCPRCQPRSD